MCVIAIALNSPARDCLSLLLLVVNSFVRWCTACFVGFPITNLMRVLASFAITWPTLSWCGQRRFGWGLRRDPYWGGPARGPGRKSTNTGRGFRKKRLFQRMRQGGGWFATGAQSFGWWGGVVRRPEGFLRRCVI